MSGYNTHQQVFAISLMSNLMQKYKGTQDALQAAYQVELPIALKKLPGQWQVAWGPVVWKHEPNDSTTGPDHVWFVARNPSLKFPDGQLQDAYVTSVAGSASTYNWIDNNARVDQVVDFPAWVRAGLVTPPKVVASPSPGGCYIAYGTALGVYRLSSVAPPASAAGDGLLLPSYWASFPPSLQTRLIHTGHSLGAALSSTLALGLFDSRAFAKFSPQNLLVYPTAGPTPGNSRFAKNFQTTFPRISGPRYEVWNCNIVNRLDIVSQAWSTSKTASPDQNMNNIPPIYGTPSLVSVVLAVAAAKIRANASGVVYIPLPPLFFKGTPPLSKPSSITQFFAIARKQHVDEFRKLFGIPAPFELAEGFEGTDKMTDEEADRTEPIFGDIASDDDAAEILRGDFDMRE